MEDILLIIWGIIVITIILFGEKIDKKIKERFKE